MATTLYITEQKKKYVYLYDFYIYYYYSEKIWKKCFNLHGIVD